MLSARDIYVGLFMAVVGAALSAVGCTTVVDREVPDVSTPTAARVGLSESQRAEFYHLDEGSEVFPLAWFKALESESGSGLFAENLQRFGFLADSRNAQNPDGLPVGMTAANTRDLRFAGVKMIGVNCAACHVAEMTVNGKTVRLDGAGGRTDISAFYSGLARATVATATTPLKFLAFLKRLRAQEANTFLSAPQANRARAAAEMLSDEGGARGESPFDKALEAELIKAVDEEMKRPPPAAAPLVLKPGPAQDAAADAVQHTVTRGLDTQAMIRRVPRDDPSQSALASEVGAADVQPAAAALFSDVLATLRLLKARVAFIVRLAQSDVKTTVPGYGRIDAFGGARNLLFTKFAQPSTAPVSYPHLWNFERVNWLHWDANTTSVLERNIGQALGLGAVLDTATFASTVSVVNLHRLEELAKAIKPPRWQEAVGPIDEAAAARGADLFGEHCAKCHAAAETELDLNVIGTDPLRATNFAAPVGTTPNAKAIADLVGKIKEKAFDEKGFTPEQRTILEGGRQSAWRETSKYAVRPLISPWATAPYLHNNSVPTLADLLLPPAQRPAEFFVGSSEYDVQKLGFITTNQPGSFHFDTRLPGNSNTGHDYGTGLSTADRTRLLEYLKKF